MPTFRSANRYPDYGFKRRVELLIDEDSWRSATGFVDRRHFRWHLLVEYLVAVKGLTFAELMEEGVTEENTRVEMMGWFSSLGPPTVER